MNQPIYDDTKGITAARIEAQDIEFIYPLREYLEQYGCRVVINQPLREAPTYFLCVGEVDFVKSILARQNTVAKKTLAIIYGAYDNELAALLSSGIKLYLLDAKPIGEEEAKKIFAFFFTGRHQSIDARKERPRVVQRSVISDEPSREQARKQKEQMITDATRIAQTMRQIFHQSGKPTPKHSVKHTNLALRISGVFLMCICIPLLLYIGTLFIGAGFLIGSGKVLLSGNIPWTTTLRKYSDTYVHGARTLLRFGSPVLDIVGLSGYAEDQEKFITVLSDMSIAESGVVTIFDTSKTVAQEIFFSKDTSQTTNISDVQALTTEVARVSQHLALVQAEVDSLLLSKRFPISSPAIQDIGHKGLQAINKIRMQIGYTEKMLALYPQMGGFRKKQTYLVLLQNSMELRPSGGFIGSLLLVSFIDGKVDDMHVLDVYTADGQLKGHVDPPMPIREIMGQEHWYLRDSNWNPDFSESGKQAAWFYEKEMGESVDGVIAISLPFVTHLLHAVGPVELSDFNERISESNFFAKSLLYTETDFFPGSTQKKDFLGALTNALLLRMTSDKSVSAGELLQSVTDSIRAKDVQFYFTDPELEKLVGQWGWDGAVRIGPCQTIISEATCVGDGVGVVEANLGINKVNYFVTREALSTITIQDDGTIQHSLSMNIKNTTPTQGPQGGGAYQVYMRLYYPKNTELHAVKLDGADVPFRTSKQTTPPPKPYLTTETTDNAVIINVPFTVPSRGEHQLLVETSRLEPKLNVSGSYQFTIRKQAGVDAYPWHVVVHYPPSWSPITDDGIAKQGSLEYNTDLTGDATVRILFQKQ